MGGAPWPPLSRASNQSAQRGAATEDRPYRTDLTTLLSKRSLRRRLSLLLFSLLLQITLQMRIVPVDYPLVIVLHLVDRSRRHPVPAVRVAHPLDLFA